MTDTTIWWVLAGAMVAIEMLTGTFYLLMVSFGFIAAALSAHAGASPTVQLVMAAAFGGGSVIFWRSYKRKQPAELPASANHNVNMDVGQSVHVAAWGPDGTSSVKYRGATWAVALRPGDIPAPGQHHVVEVVGNRLIVTKS